MGHGITQPGRLLVLGPQAGGHVWEVSSTGLTGPEKLFVLDLKAGRHAGGPRDRYLGSYIFVFFPQNALGETGEVARPAKDWLCNHE